MEHEWPEDPQDPKPEEKKEVEKTEPKKELVIECDERGILNPKNSKEIAALAKSYWNTGLFSKTFKHWQQMVLVIQVAKRHGMDPQMFLNNCFVVNDRVRIHSTLLPALIRASGKCDYIKEFFIDEEYNKICIANKNIGKAILAAVCISKRKDEAEERETYFTFEDAKQAGLTGKGVWKSWPKRMVASKARTPNLEYNFADVVCGIIPIDEDMETLPKDKNGQSSGAEINKEAGSL